MKSPLLRPKHNDLTSPDRLATPARRLPLTAKPPLTTTNPKDHRPWKARPPGDTGRSNMPQAQNNRSSATFGPQQR